MSRRVWPPEVIVCHTTDAQVPPEGWYAGRPATPVRERYHYLILRGPGSLPFLYGGGPMYMYRLVWGVLPHDVDLERFIDRVQRCGGLVHSSEIMQEEWVTALRPEALLFTQEACFNAFLAWCNTNPQAPASYAFRWAITVPWRAEEIWDQHRTADGGRVWRPVPPMEDESCGR